MSESRYDETHTEDDENGLLLGEISYAFKTHGGRVHRSRNTYFSRFVGEFGGNINSDNRISERQQHNFRRSREKVNVNRLISSHVSLKFSCICLTFVQVEHRGTLVVFPISVIRLHCFKHSNRIQQTNLRPGNKTNAFRYWIETNVKYKES